MLITFIFINGASTLMLAPIDALFRSSVGVNPLRERLSTSSALYAASSRVVNMEDNDEDDDEEGAMLGFKEESEFLEAMKALMDKTSAFSTDTNDEGYEEQINRKSDMLKELKHIDKNLDVSTGRGPAGGGGDAMTSKEGLVEELRKAFSNDVGEPNLDDFIPDIAPDDYSAAAMADRVEDITNDMDENAIGRLREVFGRNRADPSDGKEAGASKASQMLQAVAVSARKETKAGDKITSSDPVADSVSEAKSNLLESLSDGLPPELRTLKKCPSCKKPATQAELNELGKCSFCRQAELSVPRPLLARGAAPSSTIRMREGADNAESATFSTQGRKGTSVTAPNAMTSAVSHGTQITSDQAQGTSGKSAVLPPQAQAQAQAPRVYKPRPRPASDDKDKDRDLAYGEVRGTQGAYRDTFSPQQAVDGGGYEDHNNPEDDRYYPSGLGESGAYNNPGTGMYSDPYALDDDYDQPSRREMAMTEHLLELEREVLYLRALVKQMEEGLVPQIDDLRNRMDAVMQVLWNTGAVG